MYTKTRYSPFQMVMWTRWELLWFFILSLIVAIFYSVFGLTFLRLPWTPIAVIGTAVAFIIGFQNNAAYGRIWEARKIWGGMVNTSRTWGMKISDMVTNEHATTPLPDSQLKEEKRVLIYRHIAWLTALRHAMRQPKKWEVFEKSRTNKEWSTVMHIPEKVFSLEDDLFHYISDDEWDYIATKTNKATALLYLQSHHLRRLKEGGYLWEFSFLDLEGVLQELFDLQGKSERIKNFPYPRQYATLSYFFVWIFILFLPFGTVPLFAGLGVQLADKFPLISPYFVWAAVPFCVILSWVFHTMERIGRTGENPFEGSANDVPISTIARGIEIDLREMLDEDKDHIPSQFPEEYNVQM
jgi:putative membrane protein